MIRSLVLRVICTACTCHPNFLENSMGMEFHNSFLKMLSTQTKQVYHPWAIVYSSTSSAWDPIWNTIICWVRALYLRYRVGERSKEVAMGMNTSEWYMVNCSSVKRGIGLGTRTGHNYHQERAFFSTEIRICTKVNRYSEVVSLSAASSTPPGDSQPVRLTLGVQCQL